MSFLYRLFGRAHTVDKTIIEIQGQMWNSEDGRKIVLALIAKNVPLDFMLKQVYDQKVTTSSWITMEKAGMSNTILFIYIYISNFGRAPALRVA